MSILTRLNPAAAQAWLIANAAKLVVVALLLVGAYLKGRDDMHDKLQGKQAKLYEKELVLQAREQKVEVAEQAKATEKVTKLNKELASAIGDLHYELEKRPSRPECDLTDDELYQLQRLVEATK